MKNDIEALKEKMLAGLPYLRIAAMKAKVNGTVMLGILSVNPDGSGQITARFEAQEFFEDLAAILGAGPITEEQHFDANALEFLSNIQ